MRRYLALTIVLATGFAAVYALSNYLERERVTVADEYADSNLEFEGKRLRGFALGADGLLADWYWMRSLQYVGGKIVGTGLENLNIDDLKSLNPRLLYPLLDNATTLDPKMLAAYSYGATVLPAIDAEKAIELTRRGIENNPGQWRLYQYLGYIYWRLKRYDEAAEVYAAGANIAGAPPFFNMMAARMRTESGSRATAREIYIQMLAEAPDQQTRTAAELRLSELDSLDERDVLGQAIEAFRKKSGRCPVTLFEVLPFIRTMKRSANVNLRVDKTGYPTDPTGVPYILNTAECKAALGPESRIPRN